MEQRLIDANVFFEQYHYADCNIEMALEYAPTVLSIPNNPTNGDMVKTVFDDYGYNLIKERLEHFKWWNAPYKRGGTDES